MTNEKLCVLVAAQQVCKGMTVKQTCSVDMSGAVPFIFNMITFTVPSKSFSVLQALTGGK